MGLRPTFINLASAFTAALSQASAHWEKEFPNSSSPGAPTTKMIVVSSRDGASAAPRSEIQANKRRHNPAFIALLYTLGLRDQADSEQLVGSSRGRGVRAPLRRKGSGGFARGFSP